MLSARDLHFQLMNVDPWTVADQTAMQGKHGKTAEWRAHVKYLAHSYVAGLAAAEATAALQAQLDTPAVQHGMSRDEMAAYQRKHSVVRPRTPRAKAQLDELPADGPCAHTVPGTCDFCRTEWQ